jgi:hypothetical protein
MPRLALPIGRARAAPRRLSVNWGDATSAWHSAAWDEHFTCVTDNQDQW